MPDAKLAEGHRVVVKRLAFAKRPTHSEIRRSISSAYYAVFHALARTCADSLVGKTPSRRPNKAWVEVYRGLNHGVCKNAREKANTVGFPDCIRKFAYAFRQLQEQRLKADYDPNIQFYKTRAQTSYELARLGIISLNSAGNVDKKAFSAWVLISSQGARKAQEANRNARQVNIRN